MRGAKPIHSKRNWLNSFLIKWQTESVVNLDVNEKLVKKSFICKVKNWNAWKIVNITSTTFLRNNAGFNFFINCTNQYSCHFSLPIFQLNGQILYCNSYIWVEDIELNSRLSELRERNIRFLSLILPSFRYRIIKASFWRINSNLSVSSFVNATFCSVPIWLK